MDINKINKMNYNIAFNGKNGSNKNISSDNQKEPVMSDLNSQPSAYIGQSIIKTKDTSCENSSMIFLMKKIQ